jgi:hypothetical protein
MSADLEMMITEEVDKIVEHGRGRQKSGQPVNLTVCRGLKITKNTSKNGCRCLSGFNSNDPESVNRYKENLVSNLVRWFTAALFDADPDRGKGTTVIMLKRFLEDSMFALTFVKSQIAIVVLTRQYGGRTLCALDEVGSGQYMCLANFILLIDQVEEKMGRKPTVCQYYYSTADSQKKLSKIGYDQRMKRLMRSLFLAYSIVLTEYWKNCYEGGKITNKTGPLAFNMPDLNWMKIRNIAKHFLSGESHNVDPGDMYDPITGENEGHSFVVSPEEGDVDLFLGKGSQDACRQRLSNYGLNSSKTILVIAPGATETQHFLTQGFSNGDGTYAGQPRVGLFQIATIALNRLQALFDSCIATVNKKEWKEALFSGGAVKYLSTEGGVYNGLTSHQGISTKRGMAIIEEGT